MAKTEIRIHYSGLIIFAAQMVSIATGTAFTLLLTRNMKPAEYGVWWNISDLTAYFLLFSGLIPFWATRFVARGKQGATKTALLANLFVAIASAAIYIPIVPLIMGSLNISQAYLTIYILASAQIVTTHIVGALESCLRAEKPQAIGYGLLIEEACKLILAYLLIVRLQQLFLGAMISLILSASLQALFYLKLLSKDLQQKTDWDYIKQWLKGSTAILYNTVGTQLAAFVFILLFVYGTQAARADYQAAATFTGVIGFSSSLAFALYPKLLAQNGLKEVTASLRMVLMFALPIAAIIIAMSQSLLPVLNISYLAASPVLILLSIDALVTLLIQFYTSVLFGVERLDEEAKIPLRKLVKSRMFKLLTMPYVQAALTLPTAIIVLSQLANGQPVQAAVYVTAISLVAHVAVFLLTYIIARPSVRIAVPWRNVGKYLSASVVTAATLYVLPHPTTLALTFATLLAGVTLYAALIWAIDEDARMLLRLILQEIGVRPKAAGV